LPPLEWARAGPNPPHRRLLRGLAAAQGLQTRAFMKTLCMLGMLVAATAWADGPQLVNQDTRSYEYELTCGSSRSQGRVHAGSSASLPAGCVLRVRGAGSDRVDKASHCVIKDSMLDCS
jgi:hypothetical protein